MDEVNAEHLDQSLALDLHVDPLMALREQEVKRVEVDLAIVPLNLICAANA